MEAHRPRRLGSRREKRGRCLRRRSRWTRGS